MSSRPAEQPAADLVVDLERRPRRPSKRTSCASRSIWPCPACGERLAVLLGEHDRQQPDLGAVGVEDVGEARRDDRLEAVVLQAPWGVLARGAAAEVLAGDEDRVGRQVPVGLLGPVVEEELAEAGPLDALEELLGHDLVGVDIGAVEVADRAGDRSRSVPRLALLCWLEGSEDGRLGPLEVHFDCSETGLARATRAGPGRLSGWSRHCRGPRRSRRRPARLGAVLVRRVALRLWRASPRRRARAAALRSET